MLDDFTITNSKKEKLFGIIFDDKLKFQYHIEHLCKKAKLKLSALSRVAPFVNLPQKNILYNAFFQPQFSYCPLVWMCYSRTLNNKINRFHERCLRLIYNDKHSTFHELFKKKNVPFLLILETCNLLSRKCINLLNVSLQQ